MTKDTSEPRFHRLSDEELRAFVTAFLRNELFTSAQVPLEQQAGMLPLIFFPLAFGGLEGWTPEEVEQIGILYCYYVDPKNGGSLTMPRSINSYPCFMSMFIMHRDDWARAAAAIKREKERTIDV